MLWAGIAQLIWQLGTGWRVWGSNPGGAEIFHTRPDPTSCTVGTGSFLGVKWPGHGADHPLPSSAEVTNE
jgi:hypothetical protein